MRMPRIQGLREIKTVKDIRTFRGVKCPVCNGAGIIKTRLRCLVCGGSGVVRHVRGI